LRHECWKVQILKLITEFIDIYRLAKSVYHTEFILNLLKMVSGCCYLVVAD
jgi:hypothetical protein